MYCIVVIIYCTIIILILDLCYIIRTQIQRTDHRTVQPLTLTIPKQELYLVVVGTPCLKLVGESHFYNYHQIPGPKPYALYVFRYEAPASTPPSV